MEYKQIDKRSYKLHLIKTDKFKTITVRCIFKEKINKEEITIRNFLFELLLSSCKKYPSKRNFSIAKQELYDLNLYGNNTRIGNTFSTEISISMLENKYINDDITIKGLEFLKEVIFNPNLEDNKDFRNNFNITKNYLLYILSVLLVSDTVIMGLLTGLLLKDKRDFLFCEELSTYSDEIINNTVLGYSGLCITKRYIFKAMQLSKPIDLKQVEWVYRKKVTSNQNSSDNTILCMRNGKKKSISNGIAITDNDFIYKLVKYNNERALIGWSAANLKKYKEIVASENI